jgi:hypothetical protein
VTTAAPKVFAAVNAVKLTLAREGVAKAKTTQAQGRYQYRGIDDIVDAVAMPMAEAGLCVFQRTVSHRIEEHKSSAQNVLFYCYVECEFDFVSAEDGSMHTARFVGESFDSGDKSTGKAETYAFRNCLAKTFVIPVNGADADSDRHESPPVQPRTPPRREPEPPRAPAAAKPDADRYERVWFLYGNSSVKNQPLKNIAADKLAAYIARLEKSMQDKDEEIASTAVHYHRAAMREHGRRLAEEEQSFRGAAP